MTRLGHPEVHAALRHLRGRAAHHAPEPGQPYDVVGAAEGGWGGMEAMR